ncbi:MAG TPA: rod shape-determining protein MreC [Bacteroidales bacterium]|nr:rod shape-determining protein MreC [Bacteroidales bacterium]
MRSLLNFLKKYGNVLLFLLLEAIAIYLLTVKPDYHKIQITRIVNASASVLQERLNLASDYFVLNEINQQLRKENRELKNRLERVYNTESLQIFEATDSIYRQKYVYVQARVVNNSVNKQKNYITLDKGRLEGISEDMAVIGPDGIVGLVVEAGKNYSVAMSALNLDFRLSARLSKNNYFGSLKWEGVDVNTMVLNEIPHHVSVEQGDTVETTGYSAYFPEGVMVGTIKAFNEGGGDFYDIDVELSTGFEKLNNVYVVINLEKNDQTEVEQKINTEQRR